jgi:hypothetical protein
LAKELIALQSKQKVLNFRKIHTPRFLGCYNHPTRRLLRPRRPSRRGGRFRCMSEPSSSSTALLRRHRLHRRRRPARPPSSPTRAAAAVFSDQHHCLPPNRVGSSLRRRSASLPPLPPYDAFPVTAICDLFPTRRPSPLLAYCLRHRRSSRRRQMRRG